MFLKILSATVCKTATFFNFCKIFRKIKKCKKVKTSMRTKICQSLISILIPDALYQAVSKTRNFERYKFMQKVLNFKNSTPRTFQKELFVIFIAKSMLSQYTEVSRVFFCQFTDFSVVP
jgi:hypothetical protein